MRTIAAIGVFVAVCSSATGAPEQTVPRDVRARMSAFAGHWSASGVTSVGAKSYPIQATMTCEIMAGGTAVLCNTELKGRQEVMLLGYNFTSKSVWSEVVDSHDGATTSIGVYVGDTLRLSSVPATTDGKTPVIADAITFTPDGGAWSDVGTTMIDGRTVASWNLTWKRVN